MSSNLLALYNSTRSSAIRHLQPYLTTSRLYTPDKGHDAERAPSTAEEFERVAEEMSRQGVSSQTVGKMQDAISVAMKEDDTSDDEKVKDAFIEPPEKDGDFHRRE